ncbi:hypothetical protein [Nocardia wallacei]|nr:hypothetical protein [Nocardia wallacei]
MIESVRRTLARRALASTSATTGVGEARPLGLLSERRDVSV